MHKRAAALVVAITLGIAGWAECAGWAFTPEARMACCADSGPCPMHGASESDSPAVRVVTQAHADSCCAASQSDSTPSAVGFFLSLSAALVTSPLATMAPVTAPAPLAAWRAHLPLPGSDVPKHVLLSVFLI